MMTNFAAIDFETANHHHTLADAEACAVVAMRVL
jgi:DNA polymerase III epsilon subunit-like protein